MTDIAERPVSLRTRPPAKARPPGSHGPARAAPVYPPVTSKEIRRSADQTSRSYAIAGLSKIYRVLVIRGSELRGAGPLAGLTYPPVSQLEETLVQRNLVNRHSMSRVLRHHGGFWQPGTSCSGDRTRSRGPADFGPRPITQTGPHCLDLQGIHPHWQLFGASRNDSAIHRLSKGASHSQPVSNVPSRQETHVHGPRRHS
jgi:hypothetical protein